LKTQYANLIRYVPSGAYYARIRVRGKLVVKSLKTKTISLAKFRLADLEKDERQAVESRDVGKDGKITFSEALEIFKNRIQGDVSLKLRTKEYYDQRIAALVKSWPELNAMDIRKITKNDCLNWAARYNKQISRTAFSHTIGVLRGIIEIGVETGSRYDNPARFIKRVSEQQRNHH
jgi:hypothetical protein